jgi:hypothetical protein
MRAHLASATLVVVVSLLIAGCGGHTASREFNAPSATPAPASPAPPVVVAEPTPVQGTTQPVVAPPTAELARTRAAEHRARHDKLVARRKLRAARVAAAKQSRHQAAREKRLRQELAAAKIAAPRPVTHRHTAPSAPIHASDTGATDEAQRLSRVTVVRFHELMNAHDGNACALLTPRFLQDHFAGDDTATQAANCRSGVEALSSPVSVLVQSSGSDAGGTWVKVVSRFGDTQRSQIMHLARYGQAWFIDSVEAVPGR